MLVLNEVSRYVPGLLIMNLDSSHIRDEALMVRLDAETLVAHAGRTLSRRGDVVAFICTYKLPFPHTLAGTYGTVFRSSVV